MTSELTPTAKTDSRGQPGDGASANESQPERLWLSPPAIGKRLGVKPDKVRAWIRSGELRASDFAKKLGGRPRYKVHVTALISFEQCRAVKPPTITVRRRRKQPDDVIQFF